MTASPLTQEIEAAIATGAGSATVGALLRRFWRATTVACLNGSDRDISLSLSAAMDDAVVALCAGVLAKDVAIVAIGGYGRGRLAPHSDIDLLILTSGEAKDDWLRFTLHTLWDAGFGVSPITHTVDSALRSAREDAVTRTALLDARFLCGDQKIFDGFQSRFDQLRHRTISSFVDQKLTEQMSRHQRRDGFEIEPDIKEGRGGLRDLDTLHWIDRYITGARSSPTEFLESHRLFTEREERRLEKILRFFWSVRVYLHALTGRADEKLYFGLQQKLADRLGYRSRGAVPAVERFMRHYFLNAKEVARLTGTALETLRREAEQRANPARVTEVFARVTQEYPFDGETNIVRRSGVLTFMDFRRAEETPRDLFAMCRAMGRHNTPIDPEALKAMTRGARTLGLAERNDPEVNRVFVETLRDSTFLEPVLRVMTDVGLLGRFLPPYGGIIGKIEYGLFRQYTVDEHVLRSIAVLNDVLYDRDDGKFVMTKPMARSFSDPAPLYLALLLQETSAGLTAPDAADIAQRAEEHALHVLGEAGAARTVGYTVAHGGLLSRAISRRNVTDPAVIEAVCREIPDLEHLYFLAITTSCRRRTAGHGSWQEYANRDIRLLLESVTAYLTAGPAALTAVHRQREDRMRGEAMLLLEPEEVDAFAEFLKRAGPGLWSMVSVTTAVELFRLMTEADKDGNAVGAHISFHRRQGLEVIVYADDRPRMFARCAGVATEIGASVYAASAFPIGADASGAEKAALVLHIDYPASARFGETLDAEEIVRLSTRFSEVVRDADLGIKRAPPLIGDRRHVFDVTPIVRVDEAASDTALVVEVEALDRSGLLFDLATTFADLDLSIQFAFVATFGHRAVDTFYILDRQGAKFCDAEEIAVVTDALNAAIHLPS